MSYILIMNIYDNMLIIINYIIMNKYRLIVVKTIIS